MKFDRRFFIDNQEHSIHVAIEYQSSIIEDCSLIDYVEINKTANQNEEATVAIRKCGDFDLLEQVEKYLFIFIDEKIIFKGQIKKIEISDFENGFFRIMAISELEKGFENISFEPPFIQYAGQFAYLKYLDGEELSDFDIFQKKVDRLPVQLYLKTDGTYGETILNTAFLSDKLQENHLGIADFNYKKIELPECDFKINKINIGNLEGLKNVFNVKIKLQYKTRIVRCNYFEFQSWHTICEMAKCGFNYSPTVDSIYQSGQSSGVFQMLTVAHLPREQWINCDGVYTHWNPNNVTYEKINDTEYRRTETNEANKYAYSANYYIFNKITHTTIANFEFIIYDPLSAERYGIREENLEFSFSVNEDENFEDFQTSEKINYSWENSGQRGNTNGLMIHPSWMFKNSIDGIDDDHEQKQWIKYVSELATLDAITKMHKSAKSEIEISSKYSPDVDLGTFLVLNTDFISGTFGIYSMKTVFDFKGNVSNSMTLNAIFGNDYEEFNKEMIEYGENPIYQIPNEIYSLNILENEDLKTNEPVIYASTINNQREEELSNFNGFEYKGTERNLSPVAYRVSIPELPNSLKDTREYNSNILANNGGEPVGYILVGIQSDFEKLRSCRNV